MGPMGPMGPRGLGPWAQGPQFLVASSYATHPVDILRTYPRQAFARPHVYTDSKQRGV